MKNQLKKKMLLLLLAAVMLTVSACHQNPTQEKLYSRLTAHFESFGFVCERQPVDAQREVPIYKASAWQSLMLNGEEVLLYFDDSNRADYLSTFVDEETFGRAWHFGLRFVLVYNGSDETVLAALDAIENE